MDHEANEQSEREWGERDEPRFDQRSPRPTPLEEPRNLDPAEDPFDQIGKKNPERRPERTEGWNEHEIQTDGGGEGDGGVHQINLWPLDHKNRLTYPHESVQCASRSNNRHPQAASVERGAENRHDRASCQSKDDERWQQQREHPPREVPVTRLSVADLAGCDLTRNDGRKYRCKRLAHLAQTAPYFDRRSVDTQCLQRN